MTPWRRCLAAVVVLLGVTPVWAADSLPVKGSLVIAGGELRFSNAAVWHRFVSLAGGQGAPIIVVPAASAHPRQSGQATVDNLCRYGARAELLPLSPRLQDVDYRAVASDPAVVDRIRRAGGIWFIGGDQQMITRALYGPGGKPTPALEAMWDAFRRGAVIGGTSAGAAIMSKVMFADGMNSLNTLKYGIIKGKHTSPGLGFIGDSWFVDQHFLIRGRFARALVAMRDYGYRYGIGVDENTAVVVKDGQFEVVGYKGALVLDTSEATTDRSLPAFNMKKVRLLYLDAGDRMDARTRRVTVARSKVEGKVDWRAVNFMPYYIKPEDFYIPDMLSTWAVYQALCATLDSRPGVVRGVALSQPDAGRANDLGFEFRLYRGADTIGWYTAQDGDERYTVLNVYLDITPIRLAHPLYVKISR